MTSQNLLPTIYEGWHDYQKNITSALKPLNETQLALRTSSGLRSVDEIVRHMIGARARWFYLLMGEGGEPFKVLGKWDRHDSPARNSEELIGGLERTWQGMQEAINRWTEADWQQTWPGEDQSEPEIITRQWVIWHLIEHDVHHGGEISLTLGANGLSGLSL